MFELILELDIAAFFVCKFHKGLQNLQKGDVCIINEVKHPLSLE